MDLFQDITLFSQLNYQPGFYWILWDFRFLASNMMI